MAKLILDYIYEHERDLADAVFLTQPISPTEVVDYTWAQLMDQARRMAAHLRSLGFEPNARVAILSKNSAHFMMGCFVGYFQRPDWTPNPSAPTASSAPAIWRRSGPAASFG